MHIEIKWDKREKNTMHIEKNEIKEVREKNTMHIEIKWDKRDKRKNTIHIEIKWDKREKNTMHIEIKWDKREKNTMHIEKNEKKEMSNKILCTLKKMRKKRYKWNEYTYNEVLWEGMDNVYTLQAIILGGIIR